MSKWLVSSSAKLDFLVACTQLYTPLCPLVGRSVVLSFTLHFFMIFIFGPHCSCPNGLVTLIMAPPHPHATLVAVYPPSVSGLVWLIGNECWIVIQNECIESYPTVCIESYPTVCSSSLLFQKHFTLVIWIVFFINGHQVSKGKSSEFLANLEKNLANFSDFLGAK